MSTTKQMLNPSKTVFQFLESGNKVCVWLVHDTQLRYEGRLAGYDEFMNIVLQDTTEINLKTKTETSLGKILLKSDNVGVIHAVGV
ncbi:small nuclear ribonucleoprotein E [Angomonas deanei]|uniref:Small nuclear ribonucleoprotein E n=1 Tax=Angomonas deanei TaxID=59799 RepID=S9VPW8_9TRYP|nr:small nuclear ribonucleoprotein E [Angomonas deanei]EPY41458.1 small nuclear ribonucleoprotein E [Angomonas deanei]EPY42899.1 small nuclear ribonucleoprotein E [Angomonas deanei]CAD2218208.1 LSM domain containing protein, putative [Angomonas deanei]|eukprot:EPY36129.1 small nuclear ribonucleoprotein E [Angomonas deanei]